MRTTCARRCALTFHTYREVNAPRRVAQPLRILHRKKTCTKRKSMAHKIPENEIFPHRPGASPPDMRKLAGLYGFKFYEVRLLCRNGHRSPRRTVDGRCVQCRLDRWRRWRDRHPEQALSHLERMLTEKGKLSD